MESENAQVRDLLFNKTGLELAQRGAADDEAKPGPDRSDL